MEPPKAILAELGRLYEEIEPELAALTPERSAIPFLVLWLIQKSHACRYTAPGEMFEWALMSRLAAESCPPAIAGSPAKLADLRANAEAQLANALRVLGRSDEAGTVMALAWKNLQQGTGDYELRASLLRKEASRLIRLKSFETAFESLREAEGLLRGLELRQELIETETLEAAACHESGDFEYAAYLLEQALLAASQAKDIHLALALSNNLGHAYVKLGRQRHAVAAISAARDAAGDRNLHDSRYLRLHWNEGKLLVILGMLEPAERAFSRARSGFLTCGLLHEMILVTQDLVRVQRELGKLDAAERSVLATCTESHHWANGPEIVQELQRLQSLI